MGASWSVPYGSSAPTPYWGPQTSAVNFCEEDYIITRYIGEFFNTLTSLIYIIYGILGICRKRRQHVGALDALNFPYWGLIGVGIFSGLYHTTLKYHSQMSDELSMHLAIGTVLNEVFTFEQPRHIQRRNTSIIVGILVPFVIYHCATDEFVLHVVLFFAMSVIVTVKTQQIIHARKFDAPTRKRLSALAYLAAGSALTGYGIWNLDVHFCGTLTAWKRRVGLPWGALLELHGWWHVLTGVGAYTFMAIIEFLITPAKGDGKDGVGFMWPAGKTLGELGAAGATVTTNARTDGEGKGNGVAKGAVKGRTGKGRKA